MISEICQRATNVNLDRTKVKEIHDSCPELLDVNGDKQRCGCECHLNQIPV